MSALIQGFEYDIFISYRHKDNKGDHWVTEFVTALKAELESTFKENISIYFDENPHDGLLENHEVDDSLREKLKCLVLIPIISRTYCDPKAFAWEHEFKAFVRQARDDQFGLKTKLAGGNVASRVLPIKIHEISPKDKQLFENEIDGVMRSIDFIYKATGVNRALTPSDSPDKNQHQTFYRDQINKTANAISDIIAGLQGNELSSAPAISVDKDVQPPSRAAAPRRNWKIKMPINRVSILTFVAIASLLSFIILAVIHFTETPSDSRTYRSILTAPDKTTFSNSFGGHLALSPDGLTLAFVAIDSTGKTLLWIRPLNALTAQVLTGTEGATFPFWSPDSRFIGFFADGKLKKIDASGGHPLTLCNAGDGRGGAWSENGTILFCAGGGANPLSIVSAAGGEPSEFTQLDSSRNEASHRWPRFLPGGQHFLYLSRTASGNVAESDAIYLASLDTAFAPKIIAHARSSFEYANGHLLYAIEQTLMALPFDTKSLQTTGNAFPVAERVYFELVSGKTSFTVSRTGTLAYESGVSSAGINLHWYDRSGKHVGTIGHTTMYNDFRLSPDGKRIATSKVDQKTGNSDIWLYETVRDVWTRFTFDPATERWPNWSPDGSNIIFASNRSGRYDLFNKTSSGEGSEVLMLGTSNSKHPSDWSRDGKFVAYTDQTTKTKSDIWILPMDPKLSGQGSRGHGEEKPFVFLQTEFNETRANFSPDGRWIAYASDESGNYEIYIRPFPGPGGKWQVSTNGGVRPRWRGDGKELFFEAGSFNKMMAAEIKLGSATVDVGAERALFSMRAFTGGSRDGYDVTRDGQRFLISTQGSVEGSKGVTLVVNWPGEIKKK